MKKKKQKPKYTQIWYRKKAIEIAKKIAIARDGGTCQRCGRNKQSGYQIHGSHIFSVGAHPTISAEPDNIKALCSTCHSPGFKGSWHEDPAASIKWFDEKFPGRRDRLVKLEQEMLGKVDWKEKYETLKLQYAQV